MNREAEGTDGANSAELLVETADRIAVVTLQRPGRRNALTSTLLERLRGAMADLDEADEVDVVILTGADPAFCAGLDLDELASPDGGLASGGVSGDFRGPIPSLSKPLLGAVNGDAITGGLELALACDVLLGSDRARFADTHARFGMVPAWGMIPRLSSRIGTARATEMSISGRFVNADEALVWGLVEHVVPHDELLDRTVELAVAIGSNDRGAVREIRQAYARAASDRQEFSWSVESETASRWQGEGIDAGAVSARRTDSDRGKETP